MRGSVVPLNFWDSAEDFYKVGAGFSLFCDNQLASTAFSSVVLGNQLELGIETLGQYQGKGLAQYTCSALIDYCLDNGYEPVWACRLENTGSYKLALKLGFEPVLNIPYYRLSN
jgi:RimJ/RimL family protein N-acetyltransferase